MSEIELSGVTKRFGSVVALDDLSLDVGDGELVCLLGPSGCGKTTLLRVVAGLEQPDAGQVLFGGADVTDLPTRRRPIGLVFQSYALFPNLTVRQNIGFPLEVRGQASDEVRARVDELLELVHLDVEADRYPSQISGGQAQRCALARALAPRPQVLLLDEPLSALDVLVRTRLRDEIRRVQQQVGTTTIYVTHDQHEALAIADRVVVMNRGRIEQIGHPRDIYVEPRSRFTASFVGNRNAIELDARDGRAVLGQLFDVPAPVGADGTVVAYFAPENLRVDEAPGGQQATIESIGFHGAMTRVRLLAHVGGESVPLFADVPSRAADALAVGKSVQLHLDAADVRCFLPEAAQADADDDDPS